MKCSSDRSSGLTGERKREREFEERKEDEICSQAKLLAAIPSSSHPCVNHHSHLSFLISTTKKWKRSYSLSTRHWPSCCQTENMVFLFLLAVRRRRRTSHLVMGMKGSVFNPETTHSLRRMIINGCWNMGSLPSFSIQFDSVWYVCNVVLGREKER